MENNYLEFFISVVLLTKGKPVPAADLGRIQLRICARSSCGSAPEPAHCLCCAPIQEVGALLVLLRYLCANGNIANVSISQYRTVNICHHFSCSRFPYFGGKRSMRRIYSKNKKFNFTYLNCEIDRYFTISHRLRNQYSALPLIDRATARSHLELSRAGAKKSPSLLGFGIAQLRLNKLFQSH